MGVGSGPSVWVDDSHALVRRGMIATLEQAGFVVRGESRGFQPVPMATALDVLVFEAEGIGLRQAVRLTRGMPTRLVATLRTGTEQQVREAVDAGVAAVLVHGELTPEGLVATVRA